MEESLSKFMAESPKRDDENSNLIKEIQATKDASIRNQGASIKALKIQIGQMSKCDDRLVPTPGGILRRLEAFVASLIGCGGSDIGIA
ncbi:hypothetical protein Tco_0290817 [Tanacetum coccineum]